jgi:telomerase reverse transcriptase
VLNRFPYSTPRNLSHTVHVMKYIFPRQFGLHNVFTSEIDRRETVQPFKDYTLREEEIASVERQRRSRLPSLQIGAGESKESFKIPKRLRGKVVELVQKLQRSNKCCSYSELLRYYCPIEVS